MEADEDVEMLEPEVSIETQLLTYLQLQMQLFHSVVADRNCGHDEADVRDLVERFGRLQDRQMKIVATLQASRYSVQQVSWSFCVRVYA